MPHSPSVATMPLPSFRPPLQDPALAPVTSPPASPETPAESQPPSPPDSPDDDWPPPSPPPSLEPPAATRTGIWGSPGGNPGDAADVLHGLLVIGLRIAGSILRARGRELRQPTPDELDGFCRPLGRLAVRHLPLDVVGPDLVDVTHAAKAAHLYVERAPLAPPIIKIDYPEEDQT